MCRLCSLFEEDGRCINFINRTGKTFLCCLHVLVKRVFNQEEQWYSQANTLKKGDISGQQGSSSTSIVPSAGDFSVNSIRTGWQHFPALFAGNSSSIFEDWFLLLPESYDSARSNQLQFTAEYLGDKADQEMEITFNGEVRHLLGRHVSTSTLGRPIEASLHELFGEQRENNRPTDQEGQG